MCLLTRLDVELNFRGDDFRQQRMSASIFCTVHCQCFTLPPSLSCPSLCFFLFFSIPTFLDVIYHELDRIIVTEC
jgi:hypothetical protein